MSVIDLTPKFVEVARILTPAAASPTGSKSSRRTRSLPFQDGTYDHVWSYAVTMNIADKAGLGREVARMLKSGGRFSCNEIEGAGGAPTFPLPWATNEASSVLVNPAVMRAALEASGLSILEQVDLTATRPGREKNRTDADNRA